MKSVLNFCTATPFSEVVVWNTRVVSFCRLSEPSLHIYRHYTTEISMVHLRRLSGIADLLS